MAQGVALEPREPTPEPRGVLQNLFSPGMFSPVFQLFQPGQEADTDQKGAQSIPPAVATIPISFKASSVSFVSVLVLSFAAGPQEEKGGGVSTKAKL